MSSILSTTRSLAGASDASRAMCRSARSRRNGAVQSSNRELLDFSGDPRDIERFPDAHDLRVARADLLHKRRARAEISDDEHWRFGQGARIARFLEEPRRERPHQRIVPRAERGVVVADAGRRVPRADDPVALGRGREGLVIASAIVEHFRYRHSRCAAIFGRRFEICQDRAKARQFAGVFGLAPDRGQREPRDAQVGIERHRLLKALRSLLKMADRPQDLSPSEPSGDRAGVPRRPPARNTPALRRFSRAPGRRGRADNRWRLSAARAPRRDADV